MNEIKVLLTVAYDGTNYCGWQRQLNGLAVQEVLENALGRVTGHEISVTGASRTDAGVHALGQRAAFLAYNLKIPLDKLPCVINSFLPNDIVITAAQAVHNEFNPRHHAKEKIYEYKIYNTRYPNPLLRKYTYHVPYPIDYEKMAEAASFFIGTHNFSAFCAAGGSQKTTVRTIYECGLAKNGDVITIIVRGNAFLYNMVRIMAGTILYAGQGKLKPNGVCEAINTGERSSAGKTLPSEGLVLKEIFY